MLDEGERAVVDADADAKVTGPLQAGEVCS
jgi:hypothetical protein